MLTPHMISVESSAGSSSIAMESLKKKFIRLCTLMSCLTGALRWTRTYSANCQAGNHFFARQAQSLLLESLLFKFGFGFGFG
jgi:predicted ABC-type sugar transport system permease subunit